MKQKLLHIRFADYLYNAGMQSLLIEGGAKVFDHFISEGLWDEARIFHGETSFGRRSESSR